MLTAQDMNRLLRNGETVFLGVVRRSEEVNVAEKKKSKKKMGRMGAVQSTKHSDGPKKDFATVSEFRQEILGKVPEEHRDTLESILMEFKDVFPEHLPPGSPPKRQVELSIREQEDSQPPSRAPYRLSPQEQAELEGANTRPARSWFYTAIGEPLRGPDFIRS